MTQEYIRITGPQHFYLWCLRLTGWMGLLVIPVYAFAGTAGALRPEFPILFVLLMSGLGVACSLLYAGVSRQPPFLLRPTSFLKGVLVYLVIGFASGLITMQMIIMLMSIRFEMVFPGFDDWLIGMIALWDPSLATLTLFSEKARVEGMPVAFMSSFIVAIFFTTLATLPAGLASLMALFLRFARSGPTKSEVERRAQRAMAAEAARAEKEAAMRAMRIRRNRRGHA